MREFTVERNWQAFHDPKSLLLALVGEVGELSELLQWLPVDKSAELAAHEPLAGRLREELADVLLYLVRLADVVNVNLYEAAQAKLTHVSVKYPIDSFHGRAPSKS